MEGIYTPSNNGSVTERSGYKCVTHISLLLLYFLYLFCLMLSIVLRELECLPIVTISSPPGHYYILLEHHQTLLACLVQGSQLPGTWYLGTQTIPINSNKLSHA